MAKKTLNNLIQERKLQALIFDLDGVVTKTADLHARSWQKMFDTFLQDRSQKDHKTYQPFHIEEDYLRYLDGIPRQDGIRNFLRSRGLVLPAGNPADAPGAETLTGLGNLKNAYYLEMLQQGVEVYPDTVSWIRQQRAAGLLTAIISASKNCLTVLQLTGLEHLFDVRVDGIIADLRNLKGKPAPDILLETARELKIKPARIAVFEDARSGVKAARSGEFGLVVGVNRRNNAEKEALLENGADLVINHFPVS